MTLSESMIKYRTRHDISQAELSARADVCRNCIIWAENGKRVSKETEEKIRQILKGENDD